MSRALVFLLFFGLSSADLSLDDGPSVTTKRGGTVLGRLESSAQGNPFAAFYSIYYAENPTGELRFRPPSPSSPLPSSSDPPLSATEEGPPCLQVPPLTEDGVAGSEDCLWLSVFVPLKDGAKRDGPMPVLFWIHGGRALVGAARTAAYSPIYVMDEGDVIVVSVQYRLGALGFLTTEDSSAPGNYGLKDQQLALKWVADNIADFGGDPDKVTLVGHSFGAVSAHGHLFSPGSKGLFRGVVSLSGAANMGWASRFTGSPGKKDALRQATLVGCNTEGVSTQEIVDCLRKVDASELTRTQPDMHDFLLRSPAKLPLSTYMSRVDGGDAEEPFWPKDPRQAMRDGDYDKSIPWVNGVTSMEGSWYAVAMLGRGKGGGAWAAEGNLREFNADKDRALYTMCLKDVYPKELLPEIFPLYFGSDRDLTDSPSDKIALSSLVGDFLFNYDSFHGAYLHSRVEDAAPVYQYRFDYRGNWSYTHLFDSPEADYGGPGHLDDIRFFMTMGYTPEKTAEEESVARAHTGRIAQFVREGRFEEEEWPEYKAGEGKYLVIDDHDGSPSVSESVPFPRERMELWRRMHRVQEDILRDFKGEEEERRDEL